MAPELRGAKAVSKNVWCPRKSYEIGPERVKRLKVNLKTRKKKMAAEVLVMWKTSAKLFS